MHRDSDCDYEPAAAKRKRTPTLPPAGSWSGRVEPNKPEGS